MTSVEPSDPQHQVQKCGTSLSPLISSSQRLSVGRNRYRSVMSTPRCVQVAPASFVEIIVAGAECGRSGKKLPSHAGWFQLARHDYAKRTPN